MKSSIRWFAGLSLIFGMGAAVIPTLTALAIILGLFTLTLTIAHYLELLREQIVEIAKAHFDRQDHEESLK